jgi:uncharacterized delta-60 repeat protein
VPFLSRPHADRTSRPASAARRFPFLLLAAVVCLLLGNPHLAQARSADGFNPGANDAVIAVAVQPDGKVLVGGFFTALGGAAGTTPRSRIGRLHADGTVDTSFDPGANGTVFAIVVQGDGKILVGGDFTTLGGGGTGTVARDRIGRLNADGSLDTTFNPGASSTVLAITVQADGRILAGGLFTRLGGGTSTTRHRIGRLNADGSLDSGFNPGANAFVVALATQADGKILVGGTFTTLGGGGSGTTARHGIGRLDADGSLDASFNPGASAGVRGVAAIAVQSDGRILVGGTFTTLGGGGSGTTTRNRIGRLDADGSLDTDFNPGANDAVLALTIQPDGKILVGGVFTALGGGGAGTRPHNGIARLYPDGTVDMSFSIGSNPDATGGVAAVTWQPDQKLLLGGSFTTLGGGSGTPRLRIGRLHDDGTVDADVNGFTDSPVVAGTTRVKAVHVRELRARIDAQRLRFGLPAFAWTDATLVGGPARSVHVLEMRSALQAVYGAAMRALPSFTGVIAAEQTPMRATHIEELRAAVVALE